MIIPWILYGLLFYLYKLIAKLHMRTCAHIQIQTHTWPTDSILYSSYMCPKLDDNLKLNNLCDTSSLRVLILPIHLGMGYFGTSPYQIDIWTSFFIMMVLSRQPYCSYFMSMFLSAMSRVAECSSEHPVSQHFHPLLCDFPPSFNVGLLQMYLCVWQFLILCMLTSSGSL